MEMGSPVATTGLQGPDSLDDIGNDDFVIIESEGNDPEYSIDQMLSSMETVDLIAFCKRVIEERDSLCKNLRQSTADLQNVSVRCQRMLTEINNKGAAITSLQLELTKCKNVSVNEVCESVQTNTTPLGVQETSHSGSSLGQMLTPMEDRNRHLEEERNRGIAECQRLEVENKKYKSECRELEVEIARLKQQVESKDQEIRTKENEKLEANTSAMRYYQSWGKAKEDSQIAEHKYQEQIHLLKQEIGHLRARLAVAQQTNPAMEATSAETVWCPFNCGRRGTSEVIDRHLAEDHNI